MVHPDLVIRPFAAADQAAARRLILAGLGEHFGTIDESLNPDLTDIAATYLAPGPRFVVACRAGELVGTGALRFHGAGEGELVRISVSPRHRRQGIAQAIVAHLIAEARQRGLARLLVETNYDWVAAINLYRRFGFTEYERDAINVYMHLDLA
jgi:ribosomal protein S18 acetylase RimI-like enzyme